MEKLQNEKNQFVQLSTNFQTWLDVLGYSQSTVIQLPMYIREFVQFLSSNGICEPEMLRKEHFVNHYAKLKIRANFRTGSLLSNAYLNKHIQALYKFREFLLHTTNIILQNRIFRESKQLQKKCRFSHSRR
jgi:integrase/recombinase XerD